MARISFPLEDYDTELHGEVNTNPEFILMAAEGDDPDLDEELSIFLAGRAATKAKFSDLN